MSWVPVKAIAPIRTTIEPNLACGTRTLSKPHEARAPRKPAPATNAHRCRSVTRHQSDSFKAFLD
jgi:hypothetical protein